MSDEFPRQQAQAFSDVEGYETQDVGVKILVIWAVGLLIGVVITLVVAFGIYNAMVGQEREIANLGAPQPVRTLPPQPRLQVWPEKDMVQFKAQEAQKTQTYRTINPASGTVQIPVDRAMELVVERGLPSRPEAPKSPYVAPPVEDQPSTVERKE